MPNGEHWTGMVPVVLGPELAARRAEHSHSGGHQLGGRSYSN